jgi:hypothetical protein
MPDDPAAPATAREFVEEMNTLFDSTDYKAIRTVLERRSSQEEARAVLGPFQEFLERAVSPELVIDYTAVESDARIPGGHTVYHGWDGWLEHWRIWFEAWDAIRTDRRELEEIDGERVLLWSVGTVTGRGSGAELPWNSAFTVFTVRSGVLVRMDSYPDRESALEAATGGS